MSIKLQTSLVILSLRLEKNLVPKTLENRLIKVTIAKIIIVSFIFIVPHPPSRPATVAARRILSCKIFYKAIPSSAGP